MTINVPEYRPTATPVTTVGEAPRASQGPAPVRAPSRAAPVMPNLPAPPRMPHAYGLASALGDFMGATSNLARYVRADRDQDYKEALGDYYSQFSNLSDEEQDKLQKQVRDNGDDIHRAAADEIYGGVIGARRVNEARRRYESGESDPAGALAWLQSQSEADQELYDSRHFRGTYTKQIESGLGRIKDVVISVNAQQARNDHLNALFEGGKEMLDAISAQPDVAPQAIDELLSRSEKEYGPKGEKGKLTYAELDQVALKLAETAADKGRVEISNLILERARGKNPSLSNVPAYADKVEEIKRKAETRRFEMDYSVREKTQGNLLLAATEGRLSSFLNKMGVSLDNLIESKTITGEMSVRLMETQKAGAILAWQKQNSDKYAVMEGLKAQGVAEYGDDKNGIEPLSMSSQLWRTAYGDRLPDVIRDNHVNFLQATSKRLEAALGVDKETQKQWLITSDAANLQSDPTRWHELDDAEVPLKIDPTKKVHVSKADRQGAAAAMNMDTIAKTYSHEGPQRVLQRQADFLRAGNIKYEPWATSLKNGLATIGADAQLDPAKVPQFALDAYNKWRALKSTGGDMTASMMAGDVSTTRAWESVDILTQTYGNDEAGVRQAMTMVSAKLARPDELNAERQRLSRADLATDQGALKTAQDSLEGKYGQKVTNVAHLSAPIKAAATDLQVFAGLSPSAAYAKAADIVGRSWGVVDGFAVPLTSVGSVPDLTEVSRFVAQEYASAHPDVDADDLVLRPFNAAAGVWALAYRDGTTPVEGATEKRTWQTGMNKKFDGMAGKFSTEQLLNLKNANEFMLQQRNSSGTESIPGSVPYRFQR